MLGYRDFLKIAKELNKINRGFFNDDELSEAAHIYTNEYDASIYNKVPTDIMICLCTDLVTDMDVHDYDDVESELDIKTMCDILETYLLEYVG